VASGLCLKKNGAWGLPEKIQRRSVHPLQVIGKKHNLGGIAIAKLHKDFKGNGFTHEMLLGPASSRGHVPDIECFEISIILKIQDHERYL
jgi:hypothetical protein